MIPSYVTDFMPFVPPSLGSCGSGMLTTAFFAGQFVLPLVAAPLVARFGPQGTFGAVAVTMIAASLTLAPVAGQNRPATA